MTQASPSIRDNPRPDLRRKLLDSAERMFSEQSFDEVRVDDIASDAGVAKGLVYYHFDGKRGIYAAVLQAMAEDMLSRTEPDLSLPFYESTSAALDSFIAWATGVERFSKTVSNGPGADPVLTGIIENTLEQLVDRMLGGMQEAASWLKIEDSVNTPVMRHAIKGWVAYVYAVTLDWLQVHDVPADALRDLYLRALAGAITAGRDTSAQLDSD